MNFLRKCKGVTNYANFIRHKTTKLSFNDQRKLVDKIIYGQPTPATHPHMLKQNEIVQGITLDEIVQRRLELMETIKAYSHVNHPNFKNHLIVIPSATKKYISASIPYVFRQNTDFLYFSGCLENDSILALEVSEKRMKSILFMRPKDKHQEMWDGPRTGHENAPELFAVDEANVIQNFQSYVDNFRKQSGSLVWYDERNSDQKHLNSIVHPIQTASIDNPTKFIHTLRWIKSDAEIEMMRKTCEVGSQAVNETIRKSYTGISESQIFAEVDYQCRMNGAYMLAYPPVVAGGNNATIIHYIHNTQLVEDSKLILLDAGCEYGHYTSDITRTWPINGSFTDAQRVIYEIVLNVQKDLLKTLLNPGGMTLDELFDTMCLRLGMYLQEANLIPKDKEGQELARAAFKFCPHHVSHYLGMDVHDCQLVSRSNRLSENVVFTVEPGIYIPPERLDMPEEFRGIGLRIEDDVMINKNMKVEILTSSCVKEPDELLNLMKKS